MSIIYLIIGVFLAGLFRTKPGSFEFFIFVFFWPLPMLVTIAEMIYKTGAKVSKSVKITTNFSDKEDE